MIFSKNVLYKDFAKLFHLQSHIWMASMKVLRFFCSILFLHHKALLVQEGTWSLILSNSGSQSVVHVPQDN